MQNHVKWLSSKMLCRNELCYVEENVMLFACVRVFNLINRLMNCICWVYVETKLDVVKRLCLIDVVSYAGFRVVLLYVTMLNCSESRER